MKLELKHLAPYLPYKLRIECKTTSAWYSNMIGLAPYDEEYFRVQTDFFKIDNKKSWGLSCYYKPLLVPLSELEDMGVINLNTTNVLDYDYIFLQVLLRNHFDVFGLIDKGLAIDINTINEED